MTLMIISDIHGHIAELKEAIRIFKSEQYDKLIILGDIESDPKICSLLSTIITKLILVRGNMDYTINDIFLPLPLHDIYIQKLNDKTIYFSHGHRGIPNVLFNVNDICCMGHTHIGNIEKYHEIYLCNPGSIARPRGLKIKSYLIITEEAIILKTLTGKTIKKMKFKE